MWGVSILPKGQGPGSPGMVLEEEVAIAPSLVYQPWLWRQQQRHWHKHHLPCFLACTTAFGASKVPVESRKQSVDSQSIEKT